MGNGPEIGSNTPLDKSVFMSLMHDLQKRHPAITCFSRDVNLDEPGIIQYIGVANGVNIMVRYTEGDGDILENVSIGAIMRIQETAASDVDLFRFVLSLHHDFPESKSMDFYNHLVEGSDSIWDIILGQVFRLEKFHTVGELEGALDVLFSVAPRARRYIPNKRVN